MSDYAKQATPSFTARDALATGDPDKLITGALFDAEFDALVTAIASKYDSNDLASQAQAEAEASNTVLMTPLRVANWSNANAGVVGDLQALADPGADRLMFWDESANEAKFLTLGTGLTITDTTINGDAGGIGLDEDISALDDGMIMEDFSQSADGFVIADVDEMEILRYQDAGIKVATFGSSTDLAASHFNTFLVYTGGSAANLTINDSVGLVGTVVVIQQEGAGQVTLVAGGTVTLESANGLKTRAQNSVICLVRRSGTGNGIWAVFGDTAV